MTTSRGISAKSLSGRGSFIAGRRSKNLVMDGITAAFALLLALLPATATIIAAIVLAQIPSIKDILGIALVMIGVAAHKPPGATS